jgi:hypothetical protein
MEFVLCIRFAFTKIQTAQFIVVAQFSNNPESFLENLGGERGKSLGRGGESMCGTLQCPHPRNQPRVIPEPPNGRWFATTVRGLFRRFDYLTTTVVSVVCVLCQSRHIREKRWRLAHEQPHVG